ncbi:hypothetical protein QFW77_08740 [Luteimonas sp. RD2P54]|uniref:Uncharacterized protein n=1 Tax=Luteimonas endophytica TaxID=3042023 RepID=A0ABT6J8C1_9GAMM|nr:hypothetical protein [Luteimonas endophytica]MDH5823074.1 hypothetical protein [Luteimonas endophytica]
MNQPSANSSPSRHRLRRWLIGLAILAALLAVYAAALHWFTLQVGEGVQSSLREAPLLDDAQHVPE